MSKKSFFGGVHPVEQKELTRDIPFRPCPAGPELVFPLSQHIGKPARPVVQKGNRVLAGQVIAQADGFVSANVISSCSGTVKAVEPRPTADGSVKMSIVVENDGAYTPAPGVGDHTDPKKLSSKDILSMIQAAGIVGMGGAGFPTHVKLAPKDPAAIEYVIANGAECEPYITCDDQLMRTKAEEIVCGLEIILSLFPKARGVVVIEDNKPQAIKAMTAACSSNPKLSVFAAPTKYPQGGERSIISVVAGRHLRLGMLPADVGCVVDNVGTIHAIYRAVCHNEPLMERGFTVSGDGVRSPANLTVRFGTPFSAVLEAAGGFPEGKTPEKLLCGGPMMGIAITRLDVPVCKNHNGLTALLEDQATLAQLRMTECLRCGRCATVCPLGLNPQMMAAAARRGDYDRYEKKLYGTDCIACGCCTYTCPAKRPLMQLFKQTKAEIMAANRKEAAK